MPDEVDNFEQKKKVSKKTKPTSKKTAPKESLGKGNPWTFPKQTLEEAISIAKAIEEKNAGNPMDTRDIAKALKKSLDWRLTDLLRSANQYGLVNGTGATARVSLEQLGQDIVAPSDSSQRAAALYAAFRKVEAFKKVEDHYKGKRIPEDEFFFNTLTREFSIPRDRAEHFAKIFTENLNYLGSFKAVSTQTGNIAAFTKIPNSGTKKDADSSPSQESGGSREFLDTCFVMMPFGDWENKYYQKIYAPAIKDAGLEPVRADELFHTGSVVEQIYEQIRKSKVLLADLSGRNPNVFYELGVAHALQKPVIFTSSKIDDVPFDLRHLRVITYDVREPEWAAMLQKGITDYLKNAVKDPAKSIPQPFRGLGIEDEADDAEEENKRA